MKEHILLDKAYVYEDVPKDLNYQLIISVFTD